MEIMSEAHSAGYQVDLRKESPASYNSFCETYLVLDHTLGCGEEEEPQKVKVEMDGRDEHVGQCEARTADLITMRLPKAHVIPKSCDSFIPSLALVLGLSLLSLLYTLVLPVHASESTLALLQR
jgi:hypothetical protein